MAALGHSNSMSVFRRIATRGRATKTAYRNWVQLGILAAREDVAKARAELSERRKQGRRRGLVATILPGKERRFRHQYWNTWADGYERGIGLVESGEMAARPFGSAAIDCSDAATSVKSGCGIRESKNEELLISTPKRQ